MTDYDGMYWSKKKGYGKPRTWKFWTEWEEQELAEMWNEGGYVGDIAEVMERTDKAICMRLGILREKGLV